MFSRAQSTSEYQGSAELRRTPLRRSSQNSYPTHSGEYRFSVGAYAPSHFTVSRTFLALGKNSSNSLVAHPMVMLTGSPFTSKSKMIPRLYDPVSTFPVSPSEYLQLLGAGSGESLATA